MLTLTPISPRQIRVGDELYLAYDNPHENRPERVGVVTGFVGKIEEGTYCVVMYDFSLLKGAGYRSYRIDGLRSLHRIDEVADPPPVGREESYDRLRRHIRRFRRKYLGP